MNKVEYLNNIRTQAMSSEFEKIAAPAQRTLLQKLWNPFTRDPVELEALRKTIGGRIKNVEAKATLRQASDWADARLGLARTQSLAEKYNKKLNKLMKPGMLERIGIRGPEAREAKRLKVEGTYKTVLDDVLSAGQKLDKADRNLKLRSAGLEKFVKHQESIYGKAVSKDAWKGVGNFAAKTAIVGVPTAAVAVPLIKRRKERMRALENMGYQQ